MLNVHMSNYYTTDCYPIVEFTLFCIIMYYYWPRNNGESKIVHILKTDVKIHTNNIGTKYW